MNCQEVRSFIYQFIDGITKPEQTAVIQSHLQACPGCRREYRLERDIGARLKDTSTWEPLPFGLETRVISSLHSGKQENHSLRQIWQFFSRQQAWVAVAGIVLLVLGLTLNLTKNSGQVYPLLEHVLRDHNVLNLVRGSADLAVSVAEVRTSMESAWGSKLILPVQPGAGLEIVGGRFCRFGGKTPMLVFKSNGHQLSLHVMKEIPGSMGKFTMVKRGTKTFYTSSVDGYQVLMTRQGKALSLFFSDMPEKDLLKVASQIL